METLRKQDMAKPKNNKGQTLVETALAIIVLLLILVGIIDFSLAWFRKNSLKNAVRSGARVAVVTPAANIPVPPFTFSFTCPPSTSGPVQTAVCSQPGVPADSSVTVTVTITDDNLPTGLSPGDTIRVKASTTYKFFIGGLMPNLATLPIEADASMRYE